MPLFELKKDKCGLAFIKGVPQTIQKYNNLKKFASKNDEKYYVKITDIKLEWLYLDDLDNLENYLSELDFSKHLKEEMQNYDNEIRDYIDDIALACYFEDLDVIVKIIDNKFKKIIKGKNLENDVVYFSSLECIGAEEICELLMGYEQIVNLTLNVIDMGIKKEKEVKAKETEKRVEEIEAELEELRDVVYSYSAIQEDCQSMLLWIISKDDREPPSLSLYSPFI